MNIALYGGTFDPVHRGHLAVAQAAQQQFDLRQVWFVPAYISPLKQRQPVAPLIHRYAMLALATQEKDGFLPSLMEAPAALGGAAPDGGGPSYTLDTVLRFKRRLAKRDRLFFMLGIDAFLDIGKWHESEALLRAVEFIVVSRPGFSLAEAAGALPQGIRPKPAAPTGRRGAGDIVVPGATVHLLEGVHERLSATQVRIAAARGGSLTRQVGPAVAAYIRKLHLYRSGEPG